MAGNITKVDFTDLYEKNAKLGQYCGYLEVYFQTVIDKANEINVGDGDEAKAIKEIPEKIKELKTKIDDLLSKFQSYLSSVIDNISETDKSNSDELKDQLADSGLTYSPSSSSPSYYPDDSSSSSGSTSDSGNYDSEEEEETEDYNKKFDELEKKVDEIKKKAEQDIKDVEAAEKEYNQKDLEFQKDALEKEKEDLEKQKKELEDLKKNAETKTVKDDNGVTYTVQGGTADARVDITNNVTEPAKPATSDIENTEPTFSTSKVEKPKVETKPVEPPKISEEPLEFDASKYKKDITPTLESFDTEDKGMNDATKAGLGVLGLDTLGLGGAALYAKKKADEDKENEREYEAEIRENVSHNYYY